MCTYQLTFSDTLVKNARPAFSSQKAITNWMQLQLERMLKQIAVEDSKEKTLRTVNVSNRILSLSAVPPSHTDGDYKTELADIMSNKY